MSTADHPEPSPRSLTHSQSQQTLDLDGASGGPLAPPPPEIESTLSRLSAYRNVRGVMVLSRASSIASSTSSSSTSASTAAHVNGVGATTATEPSAAGGIIQTTGSVFEGEGGKKYARAVEGIASNVSKAIGECEEGDELKFMRIRTKRHELIITPDDKYLLVVLQDPGR
ncbi:dynein light chain roadblock-type [Kwoniella heveanensis BCC8398]|uniref:Dynein light chain roadblock-type n=1 Tax=Kwoniella heveanensis BCC8398 TaxID=1296120 RepID=A0A1B9GXC9_9TREE|nr:dynein light chain roadblock-type [Kwoniella heveanensis BCC8398]